MLVNIPRALVDHINNAIRHPATGPPRTRAPETLETEPSKDVEMTGITSDPKLYAGIQVYNATLLKPGDIQVHTFFGFQAKLLIKHSDQLSSLQSSSANHILTILLKLSLCLPEDLSVIIVYETRFAEALHPAIRRPVRCTGGCRGGSRALEARRVSECGYWHVRVLHYLHLEVLDRVSEHFLNLSDAEELQHVALGHLRGDVRMHLLADIFVRTRGLHQVRDLGLGETFRRGLLERTRKYED